MSFSRAFAKNAVFKGLGEVIIRLLSFAFVVLVARVVGDESFGIINFAFSFSLLFVVIVDFGLNPLLIRDAAKDPAQTRNLFFNLLLMKLVLATLFFFHSAYWCTLGGIRCGNRAGGFMDGIVCYA